MNLAEILAVLQEVSKILATLQSLGVNLSGVHLSTSAPIDLLSLFKKS